ncbi:unnamed protein product [Adineta ricciae]|uniref:ADP ribosyltransferase domain-containing protein n=1 Tax=Adineta ricciae TaxID=249248 RepID=A0A814BT31_ADIRI|nr:unnamed protein product [Adineta ricciae]CAF1024978.1 unnamed protein product [Adineta ricciae]
MASRRSIDVERSDQSSTISKQSNERQRVNRRRMQTVLVIWLDSNIDGKSDDCQNTLTQLQSVASSIDTFIDVDLCVDFIRDIKDEKACLIASGSLGQKIVPRIHSMPQMDSIFIFCGEKKMHEQWAKNWPKIQGVFTDIASICQALKEAAQRCEHNSMPICFVPPDKKLDQLDPSFMYTQMLKEILLTLNFEDKHVAKYADYCRDTFVNNKKELDNVQQFENKYRQKTPIWWYSYDTFLYPMLNRALRLMDGDTITQMGFFISDLHRDIDRLHKQQHVDHSSPKSFTVYRGQGLSKTDFESMEKSKNGLISFNSFLSTSKTRQVSLQFAQNAAVNPDLVGVVFIMNIDQIRSSTPFAAIRDVSYYQNEDEVLFPMHTVFKIHELKSMNGKSRLYEVKLALSSDSDKDLNALTDRIRKQFPLHIDGWYRLGTLILKIEQWNKAEDAKEKVPNHRDNVNKKAPVYHQHGMIKYDKEKYQEAVSLYEKSVGIYHKALSSNQSDMATSYNNIGLVHCNMGDYPKALSAYEKVLTLRKQALPPNHPDLAPCYDNIGSVYQKMGDYENALLSHQEALRIRKQSLPPHHPDVATCLSNIGSVYQSMGDLPTALSFYDKGLSIRKQILPSDHADLASSYVSIGTVYEGMGSYAKANTFYERAIEIERRSLPLNHPKLENSRKKLEYIQTKL